MTLSTIYWIIASVTFFVSMIMGFFTGTIFAVLTVALCIAGWILWVFGLISRLRGD